MLIEKTIVKKNNNYRTKLSVTKIEIPEILHGLSYAITDSSGAYSTILNDNLDIITENNCTIVGRLIRARNTVDCYIEILKSAKEIADNINAWINAMTEKVEKYKTDNTESITVQTRIQTIKSIAQNKKIYYTTQKGEIKELE